MYSHTCDVASLVTSSGTAISMLERSVGIELNCVTVCVRACGVCVRACTCVRERQTDRQPDRHTDRQACGAMLKNGTMVLADERKSLTV